MDYIQKNKRIVFQNEASFQINEILECGQCFRFIKSKDKEYTVIAFNRVIHISQENSKITLWPCTSAEFEDIWTDYFDLKRDYSEIKNTLYENDPTLRNAIDFAGGIRILNQDPWECLISFIISQNKKIPMIKQIIQNITECFGDKIMDRFYTFPTAQTLSNVSIEEIKPCKAGFRGKYILDAANKIINRDIIIEDFPNLSTEDLRKELMLIYGVGTKVSDCVMLFSCRRQEVFPTDVWVKRVMQHYYFNDMDVNINEIHSLAKEKWGDLAGFAQQYLFHYARMQKIGA